MELQFITQANEHYSHYEAAHQALEGGCRWIQLRMKGYTPQEVLEEAAQVKALCRQYNATFILNDYADAALRVEPHGVHLGKNDMPPEDARRLLGIRTIIGGTANTIEDVRVLYQRGVDYIGLGPFRYTETKKQLSPVIGLKGYETILSQLREEGISVPIIAIGGITIEDIPDLMNTGVFGIAVSGTIANAIHPQKMTRALLEQLNKHI